MSNVQADIEEPREAEEVFYDALGEFCDTAEEENGKEQPPLYSLIRQEISRNLLAIRPEISRNLLASYYLFVLTFMTNADGIDAITLK